VQGIARQRSFAPFRGFVARTGFPMACAMG